MEKETSKHLENDRFKLFIKPGCPWCVEVIDFLRSGGYAFDGVDVSSQREAFEEMKRISGQAKAPTLAVGDLLLADFGVEELIPFLKKHGLYK